MGYDDYIQELNQRFPTFEALRSHIDDVLTSRDQREAHPEMRSDDFPVAGVLIALTLPKKVIEENLPPIPHLHIIYEKRSEKLKSHPGQMAFPGGTLEEVDADAKDAAFREAKEEVGIDPDDLEFISFMDEFIAVSRVMVYPAVAWLVEEVDIPVFREVVTKKYAPRTEESDATIVMPLSYLLDPDKYQSKIYERNGRPLGWIRYFDTAGIREDDTIWGLTASMTRRFIDEIFPDNLLPEEPSVFDV